MFAGFPLTFWLQMGPVSLVPISAAANGAITGSLRRGGPHRQGLQNESILALLQCCAAKEAQRNRSENYWIQP
jgi:hypothetical protein